MVISKTRKRFYPAQFPKFLGEPDKNRFSIIKSAEFGKGVMTLVPFEKGDLVCRFTGKLLHHQTLFTLQKKTGHYLHDPWFMGRILHSCDPNIICNMDEQVFYAAKEIPAATLLTMDYETTEDQLYRSFHCNCGSPNCRGSIMGKSARLDYYNNWTEYMFED
jgi:hypothetical protein